jgi:dienelactone hydrolase
LKLVTGPIAPEVTEVRLTVHRATRDWHRPLYRPEQATDGWRQVFAFFGKHLAT